MAASIIPIFADVTTGLFAQAQQNAAQRWICELQMGAQMAKTDAARDGYLQMLQDVRDHAAAGLQHISEQIAS
jgi:hypothetical protein